MDAQNFSLQFSPLADGRCHVFLDSFLGGASGDFTMPFADQELRIQQQAFDRRHDAGEGDPPFLQPKAIGIQLFNALFQGDLLILYERCKMVIGVNNPLVIKLRFSLKRVRAGDHSENDFTLPNLPWECLYDPREAEHLNTSPRFRVVRELVTGRTPQFQDSFEKEMRMLVVTAEPGTLNKILPEISPQEQKKLYPEEDRLLLRQVLGNHIVDHPSYQITPCLNASRANLIAALKQGERGFHMIHFLCHGVYTPGSGGQLVLERNGEEDLISGPELSALIRNNAHHPELLRFIFLNACQGARDSGGRDEQGNTFSGVAPALVNKGFANVIGMSYLMEVKDAQTFAHGFYDAIAANKPIHEATYAGRAKIYDPNTRSLSWLKPVHFAQIQVQALPAVNWPLFHKLWSVVAMLLAYMTFNFIGQSQKWGLTLPGVGVEGESVSLYGLVCCTPLFILLLVMTRYHCRYGGQKFWFLKLPPFWGLTLNPIQPFSRWLQTSCLILFLILPFYGQVYFMRLFLTTNVVHIPKGIPKYDLLSMEGKLLVELLSRQENVSGFTTSEIRKLVEGRRSKKSKKEKAGSASDSPIAENQKMVEACGQAKEEIWIVKDWWQHYWPSENLRKMGWKCFWKNRRYYFFGNEMSEYWPIISGWFFTALFLCAIWLCLGTTKALFKRQVHISSRY